MRELIEQWKQKNPNYLHEYNKHALKFMSYVEEIQDFSIFNNVENIYFVYRGDYGYELLLELYIDKGDDAEYLDIVNMFYSDGSFEISYDYYDQVVQDARTRRFLIFDYEIFRKILIDSNDLHNLIIPYDIVDVYTSSDDEDICVELTRKT